MRNEFYKALLIAFSVFIGGHIAFTAVQAQAPEGCNAGIVFGLQKRLNALESHFAEPNVGVDATLKRLDYRVDELERKVAGMQKQITILHAKKADQ